MPRFSIGDIIYLHSTSLRFTIADFSILENKYVLKATDEDHEMQRLTLHCTIADALFSRLKKAQTIHDIDW